ncbi:DUF58 domain-containing protein [Georgenia sp. 10Sc9-8]|uniref:DUF58 domain-containing protein n=1 Tax=Georgenia halotolerans TaxID=3028317 RepID=A0ABT5U0D2_9MICO|nr:DUF58 domain-containing protein [Georgenia halotolerans]
MSTPRLTPRGQGFLAAGIALAALAMLLGLPDLTRVGVLLTALPLLAALSGWRPAPPLELRRWVTPPVVQAGQTAEVRLEVRSTARRRLPLQLAEEGVDSALGSSPRLLLRPLAPGDRHTMKYTVTGARRGHYRLGPLRLHMADPFGLTTTALPLPGTADLLVLPRIEVLGPAAAGGRSVGGVGRVAHMVALHGEDDASIRAYRDGDDLRRVHWPTTAHRGELMVRQEDRPARRRAVLVLDSRSAAHVGTGEDSTFERAVAALASVAVHLAGQGYALHLLSSGSVGDGTAAHPLTLPEVLRRLAVVSPTEGAGMDALLQAMHVVVDDGGLVVAAVADVDATALDRLAAVHPPGALGVMLVLGSAVSGRQEIGATGPTSGSTGWRTTVVEPGGTVAAAWERVTAVEHLRAGS